MPAKFKYRIIQRNGALFVVQKQWPGMKSWEEFSSHLTEERATSMIETLIRIDNEPAPIEKVIRTWE